MTNVVDEFEQFVSDDMAVLRELLYQVRGLSVVSSVPELALEGDEEDEIDELIA